MGQWDNRQMPLLQKRCFGKMIFSADGRGEDEEGPAAAAVADFFKGSREDLIFFFSLLGIAAPAIVGGDA